MRLIQNAADCMYKDLLCWVSYGYRGTDKYCFSYPRYALDGDELSEIDSSAFPNRGSFVTFLTSQTVSDFQEKYGDILVARFNMDEPDMDSQLFDPFDSTANKYSARLPIGNSNNAEFTVTKLSTHGMSSALVTVIELLEPLDIRNPTEEPLHLSYAMQGNEVLTSLVIVKSGGFLYGPFEHSSSDSRTIILKGSAEYDYRVYSRIRLSTGDEVAVADRNGNIAAEFRMKKQLTEAIEAGKYQKSFDWIPLDMLRSILERAMRQSKEFNEIGKNAFRRFKRELNGIEDVFQDAQVDEARKTRLISIAADVDYFINLPDELQAAITERLDDEKLAEIVLAEKNYPRFATKIRKLPELQKEYETERARLNGQLEGVKRKLNNASVELEKTRKEQARAREDLESYKDEVLAVRKEELDGLESLCSDKKHELKVLTDQKKSLEKDIDSLSGRVEDILSSLEDKARLSAEIIQSEMVRRAIAYANGASSSFTDDKSLQFAVVTNYPESDEELVELLYDRVVESAGRSYTRNDLINFFICISQGYMTTFAGRPGTGKTSLCSLIANSMGLNSGDFHRFAEISVERGWTSYRDYIGYYNPLSKTTEVSDPAMFSALQALTNEARSASAAQVAPFLFLLDEANLSPIEHYWAPFLKACDSFTRGPLYLSLGGGEPFYVPSHVRFLATVNYDHTTEELSPRYLDRAWVIMLDPEDIDSESVLQPESEDHESIERVQEAISYERIMKTFGRRQSFTIDDAAEENYAAEENLNAIIKICSTYHHPISQRSQIMIRNYMSTASALMERESADTRLAPLDYAISQKVLPTISGAAEQYEEFLQRLDEQCSSLPLTHKRLKHIMDMGANSGYYQFFV